MTSTTPHLESTAGADGILKAIRRFQSPALGALLILTILLGKTLVCHYAPGRVILFDAMLLVPISLLAYHEGLVTGLVAALVASAADIVISASAAGLTTPLYLAAPSAAAGAAARLFTLEVAAAVVAALSRKARKDAAAARQRAEQYLSKILLLQEQTEAIQRTARDQQAAFEQNLLNYSSLVSLLEESAQKIYSNLDIDSLFQSLFRVLEECFGATCSSVYLKDPRNNSYFLAAASGADTDAQAAQLPLMIPPDDPAVARLEGNPRAANWIREPLPLSAQNGPRAVVSGTLLDKGAPIGLIHVHQTDGSITPDARLMTMICNIASIALANARLFGEVQWMAERDPLTRLFNRRTFHEQIEAQIAARSGPAASYFALLMLDLDHFKTFNDTYGHQAGDAVLEQFAAHCEECAGESCPVFRYGGEEFIVLMPHADADAALRLAEKIRLRIEHSSFRYGQADLHITLSCGIAVFPRHGSSGDELVRSADRALYTAKAVGRNSSFVTDSTPPAEVLPASWPGSRTT